MVRDLSRHFQYCSINTATLGFRAPVGIVIEDIARAGFRHIAPWRREVEGGDIKAIAKHISDAGLKLSGYCRSTYIPAATATEYRANIDANKTAMNDAAILGAPAFVMVVGGMPAGSKDMSSARRQVKEACTELAAYGQDIGVKIALEPLHPVYAAERSCLTLLSEALDWCDEIENPFVGVAIDCYHVWWDPNLKRDIVRAGYNKRILAFHVCDWLVPTTDVLNDRGMMGDGVIDIQAIRSAVEAAGYKGAVEVEIFSSANWWKRDVRDTLNVCRERLLSST
jgi:sugar phosphate isomerase/epimerase